MRWGIAAVFTAVFIVFLLCDCAFAPLSEASAEMDASPVALTATPAPTQTPRKTALITPVPTPDSTSEPCVDAPWYAERNAVIRKAIMRYQPWRTPQEISDTVDRMSINPDLPMIALTFDDGPVVGVTDKILDVLEQYNVRATFFICGWRLKDKEAQNIIRRAVSLGCEIGNHTWAHHDLQKQNIVEKKQAIVSTNQAVFDVAGYVMHCVRPPGGHNDWDVNRIARSQGMAVILWSQSGNVHENDPEKIAQNVQQQIVDGKELHDGDIILLHDTKQHMVDAVKIMVPQLLDEGYQLVTVWELLNCSEDGFTPGITYLHQ